MLSFLKRPLLACSSHTLRVHSSGMAIPFELALTNPNVSTKGRFAMTKLTATIGPASEKLPIIHSVVGAGVSIMRINFSHATYEEANLRVTNLNLFRGGFNENAATDALDKRTNMRSIMLDTQGPEIRTGSFDGVKELDLLAGSHVLLTTDDSMRNKQTADKLWISYKSLPKTVQPQNIILLDDGAIQLEVVTVLENSDIQCKVINTGTLGSKKGVNMPGLVVDLPAMSEKDKEDIRWGIVNDIDMIAASFVRKPSDVTEIRNFCAEIIGKQSAPRLMPLIVSKIESTEALQNFEAILDISDAIMVARGDLAVEIPMETLAGVQKEIVKRCNAKGKPVIVATQMLESMQKQPRPTRAEITDVTNAILDGADGIMLSGESAKGKYPVGAIDMMRKITLQTELLLDKEAAVMCIVPQQAKQGVITTSAHEAVAQSTVALCNALHGTVAGIIVEVPMKNNDLQLSSPLPTLLSQHRPFVPIFTLVPTYKAGRMIQIFKGIQPILAEGKSAATIVAELRQAGKLPADKMLVLVKQEIAHGTATISLL